MFKLGEITKINRNITSTPVKAVRMLHKLIFKAVPEDRKNQKHLREFSGFTFEPGSEDYVAKVPFINNLFTKTDLAVICNILCIDISPKQEMIEELCLYLLNVKRLSEKADNENNK